MGECQLVGTLIPAERNANSSSNTRCQANTKLDKLYEKSQAWHL